jgi:hypothetical protein
MKTAGRKTKATNVVASRVCGTEGENNLAPWGGLDGKKNSGHRKSVFSLTPFMELPLWNLSGVGARLRVLTRVIYLSLDWNSSDDQFHAREPRSIEFNFNDIRGPQFHVCYCNSFFRP